MKRIYLLMFLFVAFAGNAFAQKTLNLELQHLWSETGGSGTYAEFKTTDTLMINGEKAYWYGWRIINYGPDTSISTDSLKLRSTWGTTYRGQLSSFGLGLNDSAFITPADQSGNAVSTTLSPGSGISMSGYQSVDWCDSVWVTDANGNAYNDDTLANNLACTQITVLYWLLSVDGELKTDKEAFMLYPNPATQKLNIKYNFGTNNAAAVRVIDVTGKTVHNQDLGTLSGVQDVQLNLQRIPAGVYVVQLVTNDRTLTRQLYIK